MDCAKVFYNLHDSCEAYRHEMLFNTAQYLELKTIIKSGHYLSEDSIDNFTVFESKNPKNQNRDINEMWNLLKTAIRITIVNT